MRKLKGLIIMLCISLSLFGMTACSDGGANSYEQITPQKAKTIMDTKRLTLSSMPVPTKNLPKVILRMRFSSPNMRSPLAPKRNCSIRMR